MIAILLSLLACETTPQTSYCESLCDWGTECAAAEREWKKLIEHEYGFPPLPPFGEYALRA